MNRIAALFLAFALAGCASIPNPVTQVRVDALNASWGASLAVFNGYYDTCERRIIHQSCRTVVAKIKRVAPSVQAKVTAARNFATKPTLTSVDLVVIAEQAVDDFKKLQADLGVK
jgi:hypothetical protein